MTSRCSATTCHSASGESTPPGKRQPMPTITIGSLVPASSSRTR
ncbi:MULTISPECIES: CxxxxCH/CxxCH domain-containing protein [unclassified Streptomyces]